MMKKKPDLNKLKDKIKKLIAKGKTYAEMAAELKVKADEIKAIVRGE